MKRMDPLVLRSILSLSHQIRIDLLQAFVLSFQEWVEVWQNQEQSHGSSARNELFYSMEKSR